MALNWNKYKALISQYQKDSLYFNLSQFNVKIKIIKHGSIKVMERSNQSVLKAQKVLHQDDIGRCPTDEQVNHLIPF